MQQKFLAIEFGRTDPILLKFSIRDTPVAKLWLERMHNRSDWKLDQPNRFYHFGTLEQEQQKAQAYIQQCIDTINNHQPLIKREFEWTQDCLNYMHNIFELHHGLLDNQTSEYWQSAPDTVRAALAELNLAVHRCEGAMKGELRPRFVCTWYGMPKVHRLDETLQILYGDWQIKFGTVYLNYCEIGKTAEDLAHDNDQYIADNAFKPFSHYSADFSVHFYDRNLGPVYGQIQKYIDQHQDFFLARNITSVYNIKARPLRFPVADLVYTGDKENLVKEIAQRQWVNQIEIQ